MKRTLLGGLGVVLVVAGCRSSERFEPQADAVRSIESGVQDSLGLGDLAATCDEPAAKDVGTTFTCTATTPDGATIQLTAEIGDAHEVSVQPTNVISTDNLSRIEAEAARILTEQVGQELPAENIDCGDHPIVAEAGQPIVCALTDPGNPDNVYDASITLDDLTSPSRLEVQVANAPRG